MTGRISAACGGAPETRRAREAREMESLQVASEDARWLRDARVEAYAGFSVAAEEVLQFMRTEMPALTGPDGGRRRDEINVRWIELRTEFRKAYNQVAFQPALPICPLCQSRSENAVSQLGTAGENFLETCRASLHGDKADAS
jgi:hypothetical protein